MPYVYSTLANDNAYTVYAPGGGDVPRVARKVLILGGAGIAGPFTRLQTPQGVATKVTDEDVADLKENVIFQRHMANGFVTIDDRELDPENVAADMTSRDPGGPLVDADFDNVKTPDGEQMKAPTHTGKHGSGSNKGRR